VFLPEASALVSLLSGAVLLGWLHRRSRGKH
jgi:hypothetical protein